MNMAKSMIHAVRGGYLAIMTLHRQTGWYCGMNRFLDMERPMVGGDCVVVWLTVLKLLPTLDSINLSEIDDNNCEASHRVEELAGKRRYE